MKIETKFSIGDVVWWAFSDYGPNADVDCPECNGKGSFAVEGKTWRMRCTGFRCRDGKVKAYAPLPYARRLTIGQVGVTIADSPGDGGGYSGMAYNYAAVHKREEKYMAVETGIGSGNGNLYDGERLFATEEEALLYAKLVMVPELINIRQEQEEREERDRQQRLRQIEAEDAA